MNLIPVLDLMQGQVVRAVRGNRDAYRPIVSQLCAGSDPVSLAQALCEHCASSSLYIADLDALRGGPAQVQVLRAVLEALPDVELWLDAGFADAADLERAEAAGAAAWLVASALHDGRLPRVGA